MQTTRRSLLAGAAALGLGMPHVARAAVRTIVIGHNSVMTSQFGQGCTAFAEAVAAHPELSKVARVNVRGNAELGDELAMLKDCREGTIDMMVGASLVAGKFCPEIAVLDVPFVFRDVTRGRAAFDGPIGAEYAELLKTKDINIVAWFENGLRQLTSSRAVRAPADMHGLKLRVPQSDVALASFSALGAEAQPLPYSRLYEALRTGQFEAQENPIASIEDIKLNEVQKYLCLTGHTYSTGIVVASPDLVDDLGPAQFRMLRACAMQGTLRSRLVAETAARDGIGRLKAAGMTVIDDVDLTAFAKASAPNLDTMGQRFGHDRVQRLVAAAAA